MAPRAEPLSEVSRSYMRPKHMSATPSPPLSFRTSCFLNLLSMPTTTTKGSSPAKGRQTRTSKKLRKSISALSPPGTRKKMKLMIMNNKTKKRMREVNRQLRPLASTKKLTKHK